MKFKKTEVKRIQKRHKKINQLGGGGFDGVVNTIVNMIDGLLNANKNLKIKYYKL